MHKISICYDFTEQLKFGFRFPDLRQENPAQMWVEVQMNRGKMHEASWARP